MTTIPTPPPLVPSVPNLPAKPSSKWLVLLWLYVGQLIVAVITVGVISGALLLVVPKFHEIFNDFRTSLPTLTEWCLNTSDFFCHGGFLLAPVLILLFPVPLTLLGACLRERKSTKWLLTAGILIQILLLIFSLLMMVLALGLPLIKLIQAVSGGESGSP